MALDLRHAAVLAAWNVRLCRRKGYVCVDPDFDPAVALARIGSRLKTPLPRMNEAPACCGPGIKLARHVPDQVEYQR
jgi:hypothetical protein